MTPVAQWWAMVLAQDSPFGNTPTEFAGYGVVGLIAFGGLLFAWRAYRAADAERIAAQDEITALQRQLLAQAAEHKDELLTVYRAVMPVLESATATVKESSRLIEEQRMAERLKGKPP